MKLCTSGRVGSCARVRAELAVGVVEVGVEELVGGGGGGGQVGGRVGGGRCRAAAVAAAAAEAAAAARGELGGGGEGGRALVHGGVAQRRVIAIETKMG